MTPPHLVSNSGGRTPNTPARRELPYVLIADGDERRIEACIAAITPHQQGALVAANTDEAIRILERFGAPLLLFTDILLPTEGGFALIEAVRRMETARTGIVAWASARAMREFAVCHLSGMHVRVLRGSAPAPVVRSLVDAMLKGPAPHHEGTADGFEPTSGPATEDLVDWLQAKAREICGTPGIAVYMREETGNSFRSSGSWTPDEPIPQSLDYLPHALNRVMETHEPFVAFDVHADPVGHVVEERGFGGLRGLIAVPVFARDGKTAVGMICAFDVKPLALDRRQVEALSALGRTAGVEPSMKPVTNRFAARRSQSPARLAGNAQLRAVSPRVTLLDREAGSAAVARELARVRREQYPLSVVLFDINAGTPDEAALSPTAASPVDDLGPTLTRVVRGSDLAIRWGRQELLLVLPGIHSPEARRVADRVRQAVQSGVGDRVAIAEGVAELGSDTWESTLSRAGDDMRGADQPPVSAIE